MQALIVIAVYAGGRWLRSIVKTTKHCCFVCETFHVSGSAAG